LGARSGTYQKAKEILDQTRKNKLLVEEFVTKNVVPEAWKESLE